MFIHWGLYALAARHEWVKKNERISDNDYQTTGKSTLSGWIIPFPPVSTGKTAMIGIGMN
jgi:hypothetical protein